MRLVSEHEALTELLMQISAIVVLIVRTGKHDREKYRANIESTPESTSKIRAFFTM